MKFEINEFLRHSLSKPVFEYEIEPSAPSSWISSLQTLNSWSNRSIEWVKAKNRFLFSSDSEVIANKWVTILEWMVKETISKF